MLMKVLKRLSEGGIYSNKKMADELGIDEGLVEHMIIQLNQKGYIEKDNLNNTSDCPSCCGCSAAKKGSCCDNKSNIDVGIWRITTKGIEALNKN